jgi:uncharacterized UBP type Zn finger protein
VEKDNKLKTINGRICETDEKIKNVNEQIEIINNNSRKQTLNIIYESFRKFGEILNKNYSSAKQKKQNELKIQLFSGKNYSNAGLRNIGNNCYMNSGLQILKNIPLFTYKLSILNDKSNNFLFSLKHLLISICNNNISYYSPDEIKKNLGLENKLFEDKNNMIQLYFMFHY